MPPGPSHSSDGVEDGRRRFLEDGETIPSKHSSNPNRFSVVSSKDVKPDPGGLTAQLQNPMAWVNLG